MQEVAYLWPAKNEQSFQYDERTRDENIAREQPTIVDIRIVRRLHLDTLVETIEVVMKQCVFDRVRVVEIGFLGLF